MIDLSLPWKKNNPEACVGLLAVKNAPNLKDHPDLKIGLGEIGS